MGNCAGRDNYKKPLPSSTIKNGQPLHKKEQKLLELIFDDLASRTKKKQLNKQNFLLFFHKNGFWGDRLFKQFDANSSNMIDREQFIKGIVKIFKTSEQQKIKLLYKFFSGGSAKTKEEGVPFEQFLKMLYNYPKEDLQRLLGDSDFFNNEIKNHLVAVNSEFSGRRFQSVCNKDIRAQFKFEDSDKQSQRLQSKVGKDLLREMSKKKPSNDTTLKINVGGNNVQIKTSSIHHLVKKFARSIFKSFHINEYNGRLTYEQFRDWLTSNKSLYDDYYNGFHSQIWQVSKSTQLPQYLNKEYEMTSRSRMINGKTTVQIKLILLHSILIATEEQHEDDPLEVICLDGLSVEKTFDSDNGYGILISHRDKYYNQKKFYFLNDKMQNKWMEHMKFFKGSSINAMYELGQEIGKGKFSLVYQGIEKETEEKCAIKIINKKVLDKQSLQLIAHESSIMSVLSHPLMVHFKQTIQTNNNIYIVTQLVKGKDLFEFVKDVKSLGEPQAAFIFKQIIVGIRYLHSLGIVHRDLKPENVMVQYDEKAGEISKIKIIDFGFANYLSVILQMEPEQRLAGTPNYIAPQILSQQDFSEKIDNFAIGSMLYFALSGAQAFAGESIKDILQNTINGSFSIKDRNWKKISDEAKNLVQKLLQLEPSERMTLDEAIRHPWFTKVEKQNQKKQNQNSQ